MPNLISQEVIVSRIYLIRYTKVMIDKDLAGLYGVTTSVLNQAVKRNKERFPGEFMFRLTKEETKLLRSQIVILKQGKHLKYLPYAFTEQGVAMLSSVLNSRRAIQVNIAIMKTFVKLREILSTNKELAHKLAELENKIERHDHEIKSIFEAIRQLMTNEIRPKRKIGFCVE